MLIEDGCGAEGWPASVAIRWFESTGRRGGNTPMEDNDSGRTERDAQDIMNMLGDMFGHEGPPVNDDTASELFDLPEGGDYGMVSNLSIHLPTNGVLVEQKIVDEAIHGELTPPVGDFDETMEGVAVTKAIVMPDMLPRITELAETAAMAEKTGQEIPDEVQKMVGGMVEGMVDGYEANNSTDDDEDDGGFSIEVE